MKPGEPTLDAAEFLREREREAYLAWKQCLDDLLVKQAAWERARRALHQELEDRSRLLGMRP